MRYRQAEKNNGLESRWTYDNHQERASKEMGRALQECSEQT